MSTVARFRTPVAGGVQVCSPLLRDRVMSATAFKLPAGIHPGLLRLRLMDDLDRLRRTGRLRNLLRLECLERQSEARPRNTPAFMDGPDSLSCRPTPSRRTDLPWKRQAGVAPSVRRRTRDAKLRGIGPILQGGAMRTRTSLLSSHGTLVQGALTCRGTACPAAPARV